jgi:hypothetical protein
MRELLFCFFSFLFLVLEACGGSDPFQGVNSEDGSFQHETEAGVAGTSGEPGSGRAGEGGAIPPDAAPSSDGSGSDGATPVQCERRVLMEDITNARDLGGHPLFDGQVVACRKVLHGGSLFSLSTSGCEEFASLGIRTVLDLRELSDQQGMPPPSCVQQSTTVIDAAMPKLLPDTPENYLALFDETAAISTVFSSLGKVENYPVYFHCVIGRDRASFVAALILLALGADRQTVIDEFMLSEEASVLVHQECIEAVLDEIERRGGIEAFLSNVGITPQQLEVLRMQAVAD